MKRADAPAIWSEYRAKAEKLKATAETLTVTDISQVAEMKLARATRLTLKELRVEIEKRRKELGEFHLRETQKINADAKTLKDLIEPLEARLLHCEQFAERAEADRKAALKKTREEALAPYGTVTSMFNLPDMPDEAFADLLGGIKAGHEAKLAAAAKVESDRIAKEKADAEERERIRVENIRLKKEAEERNAAVEKERKEHEAERAKLEKQAADERNAAEAKAAKLKAEADEAARVTAEKAHKERRAIEAKAKAERLAAEAVARKEREAREKIEAELTARREAEESEAARKLAEAEAAALAPEKEKLAALAASIRALSLPTLKTRKGIRAMEEITAKVEAMAAWVERKAAAL